MDTINYQLSVNSYINIDLLDSKIKVLKVLYYDDFAYAFYSGIDNVIAINEGSKYTEAEFCQIITHETNHLVQDAIYKWDDILESNIGTCYQFKDIELNYLYWSWYIEASAQINVLNQLDAKTNDSFLYEDYVENLKYFNSTIALLNENVNKLWYITAQNDLDILFELFNCQTEEDKIEIIKLMSAIQLIDESDEIFSDVFYDKTNADDDMYYDKYLKEYIGRATSKIFYQNLARKIENKSVKLGDVFSLISSFESYLSKSCWYDSSEFEDYIDDFYKDYKSIQDEFFKVISSEVAMTIEELYKYHSNFYHTIDHIKYQNSLLNDEQQEFYKKIYERKYFEIKYTVNEAIKVFAD